MNEVPTDPFRKALQKLTLVYPGAEHRHKNCPGWDHDDPEYCCEQCPCCPCFSWRCNTCLWTHKPLFKQIARLAWGD